MNRILARIKPVLSQWFWAQPKSDCEARRLPVEREAGMTFGYYNIPTATEPMGVYYYNGENELKKPRIGMASLICHELLPGHHFQICLTHENKNLHSLRKNLAWTAYIEGWAEYAAFLAGEMGMYDDPYHEYGRLITEMFMTTRLVVDTGMNALNWSRLEASEFMKGHTWLTDQMVLTETLRYACDMPAQALAYKTGMLKMLGLREKTKKLMGKRFDIKDFHEIVLGEGCLPFHSLEKKVTRYAAKHKE